VRPARNLLSAKENAPGVCTPDAFFARHFILISLADWECRQLGLTSVDS
jgi:hypothetical protein